MPNTFQVREPGEPISFQHVVLERSANLTEGTADMNADGKSDDFVLPAKQANKAETLVAELVEGRRSPKGSAGEFVCIPDTEPEWMHINESSATTGSDVSHRDRFT
jgi:hypothetical protein